MKGTHMGTETEEGEAGEVFVFEPQPLPVCEFFETSQSRVIYPTVHLVRGPIVLDERLPMTIGRNKRKRC